MKALTKASRFSFVFTLSSLLTAMKRMRLLSSEYPCANTPLSAMEQLLAIFSIRAG